MSDSSCTTDSDSDSSQSLHGDAGFAFKSIIQDDERVKNFFNNKKSTLPYYINNKAIRTTISELVFEKKDTEEKKGQRVVQIFNPPGISLF